MKTAPKAAENASGQRKTSRMAINNRTDVISMVAETAIPLGRGKVVRLAKTQ